MYIFLQEEVANVMKVQFVMVLVSTILIHDYIHESQFC